METVQWIGGAVVVVLSGIGLFVVIDALWRHSLVRLLFKDRDASAAESLVKLERER